MPPAAVKMQRHKFEAMLRPGYHHERENGQSENYLERAKKGSRCRIK